MFAAPYAYLFPRYLEWLPLFISWPVVPAMGLLVLVGRRGGPEGLPPVGEAYALAFFLCGESSI
jgi:hypothetical protein